MPKLNDKILFVDDDENILLSYRRKLRKTANIYTANGGEAGLQMIKKEGPFAVVISDMRMPKMNGAEFLSKVKSLSPDSVRIILTGQSDMDSAIEAINNGQIFRFLTKPCPSQSMAEALISGIGQYRLQTDENEVLEKTLKGSVKVLTEVLSMANPKIFGHANRFRYYVEHLVESLGVKNSWDIEVASMLSCLGYITLPEEIIDKIVAKQTLTSEEQEQVDSTSEICVKLLCNIPRLNVVTAIIEAQHSPFQLDKPVSELSTAGRVRLCGHILKVAKHVDHELSNDRSIEDVVKDMGKYRLEFDSRVVRHMLSIQPIQEQATIQADLSELAPGMILEQNIYHKNGTLLLSKGHEINDAAILHLENQVKRKSVEQPFLVKPQGKPCPVSKRENGNDQNNVSGR